MKTLTLNQAAERAGVSRWTVSRALQDGRLKGIRDNRGRWRIEPEPLDAWAAEQSTVQAEQSTVLHAEQHGATVQATANEIAGLRLEVRGLREQLDKEREERLQERATAQETAQDLRKRLDESQGLARALAERPAPEAPAPIEDLRKRLEETEAWIAALTAPEKPQEAPVTSAAVTHQPEAPKGLLARLLRR